MKKTKVVLVRPNYDSHIITPPLGLGYLSAYLKKEGIETRIIDGLRDRLSSRELFRQILIEKPDLVGITCLTAFYNQVIEISQLLKKEGLKVVIGGVHPTFLPQQTLEESGADYVICGEAEQALTKLIKSNFNSRNIQGIYSLKQLKKTKIIKKAVAVENLDDLPIPDWEQIDPNTYPKAPHGAIAKNFPIGIIITTRGCPYMCSFCASPQFYDRKIRFRSPEKVIEEIKYLKRKFGVKEIHFEDDNLTLKRDHVEKLCRLIIKNKLDISWACPNGIRADRVDLKLLKLMKKSGCYYIAFGVESANPRILKNIHKLETLETIEKAIQMANQVGIQTQGFFIFGLPGENKQTMEQNIRFAKRSKLARAQFIILDVLPGSELWNTLKGKFIPNWQKKSYKEPEWVPPGLTKEDLMETQSRAFREFYFRPIILFRLLKSLRLNQVKFILERFKEYRIFSPEKLIIETEGKRKKETKKEQGLPFQPSLAKILNEIKSLKELEIFLNSFFSTQELGRFDQRLRKSPKFKELIKRAEAEEWAEYWSQRTGSIWPIKYLLKEK